MSAPAGDREPSKEEDDALFLATGFRHLPARERGFPHPWCAKKSGKGWIVRDAPPDRSRKGPDGAAQFRGWRAAEAMLRSREILMERVRNREPRERERSRSRGRPPKKRTAVPPNDGIVRPSKTIGIRDGERAVDRWFRDTDAAVRSRQRQSAEEDFRSLLKKRKVEAGQERKKKRKEARMEAKRARIEAKIEARASRMLSEEKSRAKGSVPSSPTKKKHKKATPTKKNIGSIMLGEDPQLDDMIAGIVDEFTHEFARGQDSDVQSQGNSGAGSHIQFDGSAVSALREAARDTLATMTKQGTADRGAGDAVNGAAEGTKKRAASSEGGDAAALEAIGSPVRNDNGEHSENDNDNDRRIADMVEQLIGEVAHGSGCRFDGRAVAALKEAAKEIVEDEG